MEADKQLPHYYVNWNNNLVIKWKVENQKWLSLWRNLVILWLISNGILIPGYPWCRGFFPQIFAKYRRKVQTTVFFSNFSAQFLLFNTKSNFDDLILFWIGASIRLDTTLVDFTEMRWERGDITFLYRGDAASPEESLYVLDNQLRVYQKVYFLNTNTYSP